MDQRFTLYAQKKSLVPPYSQLIHNNIFQFAAKLSFKQYGKMLSISSKSKGFLFINVSYHQIGEFHHQKQFRCISFYPILRRVN